MSFRPVTLLTLLLLAAPSSLDAQVRPDRTRQFRGGSPCGANQCHHSTRLQDVPSQVTGIAGESGEASEPLDIPEAAPMGYFENVAFKSLRLGERGDEPCFLSYSNGWDEARWSACGRNARTVKSISIDGPNVLIGLRVCTNGRNNQRGRLVKGIRVRVARRPHETRALDQIRVEQAILQPNCSDWSPWVQCPAGTAAWGMVAHHDAIGGRRGLVGLQLECLPVDPVCYAYNDDIWDTYSPPMQPCNAADLD